MYYVYIVECSDKTYYTGSTNDIENRVKKHNTDKTGAKYTRSRRPVVLKYYEEHPTKSEALVRENQIKNLTRRKKEELIQTAKT